MTIGQNAASKSWKVWQWRRTILGLERMANLLKRLCWSVSGISLYYRHMFHDILSYNEIFTCKTNASVMHTIYSKYSHGNTWCHLILFQRNLSQAHQPVTRGYTGCHGTIFFLKTAHTSLDAPLLNCRAPWDWVLVLFVMQLMQYPKL